MLKRWLREDSGMASSMLRDGSGMIKECLADRLGIMDETKTVQEFSGIALNG